jgi:hypothetical protein
VSHLLLPCAALAPLPPACSAQSGLLAPTIFPCLTTKRRSALQRPAQPPTAASTGLAYVCGAGQACQSSQRTGGGNHNTERQVGAYCGRPARFRAIHTPFSLLRAWLGWHTRAGAAWQQQQEVACPTTIAQLPFQGPAAPGSVACVCGWRAVHYGTLRRVCCTLRNSKTARVALTAPAIPAPAAVGLQQQQREWVAVPPSSHITRQLGSCGLWRGHLLACACAALVPPRPRDTHPHLACACRICLRRQ